MHLAAPLKRLGLPQQLAISEHAKGTPTTRAVLEQFGLIQYFDHVQGTDGFPL